MLDSRLELTRFAPFSHFWTCWKVSPSASATASWPNRMRRSQLCGHMNIDRTGKALAGHAAGDNRSRAIAAWKSA